MKPSGVASDPEARSAGMITALQGGEGHDVKMEADDDTLGGTVDSGLDALGPLDA